MPQADLNLILLFDRREETCAIIAHNLSASEADTEVKRLRAQELPAYSLAQKGTHTASEAETCRACAAAVSEVMTKGKGATRATRSGAFTR